MPPERWTAVGGRMAAGRGRTNYHSDVANVKSPIKERLFSDLSLRK